MVRVKKKKLKAKARKRRYKVTQRVKAYSKGGVHVKGYWRTSYVSKRTYYHGAKKKPKKRGYIRVKGYKNKKGARVKGYWRKKSVRKKGGGLGGKEKEKGPFDQIKMYRYGLYVNAVPVHSKPWAHRYVSVKVTGYSDHPNDLNIEIAVAERFEKVLAKALESAQYAKDIIHGGADYSAGIERWREIGFAGRSLIGVIEEKVEWS